MFKRIFGKETAGTMDARQNEQPGAQPDGTGAAKGAQKLVKVDVDDIAGGRGVPPQDEKEPIRLPEIP